MLSAALPRLHFLSDGETHLAVCPERGTVLSLDPALRQALEAYVREGNLENAASRAAVSTADLAAIVDRFTRRTDGSESAEDRKDGGLDRLVLHVTNSCNLHCAYCYADGGSYGLPRGRMPRGVAFAGLTWAAATFGGLRSVQLFGGEPMLNPLLIAEVCEYLRVLHDTGKLPALPRVGLVSNGTVGGETAPELFARYGLAVTLSLDGPEEIHDALRGAGTFMQVDQLARRCIDRGVEVGFQCTWTPLHAERGISVVDLVEHFFARYGTRVLHVVPVAAAPESPLRLNPEILIPAFRDAARHTVRTFAAGDLRGNSLAHRVLDALHRRGPGGPYCPAGRTTLALAADGWLYPCFMFNGDSRFRLCRFHADGTISDRRSAEVIPLLAAYDKDRRADCRSCWAAPFCSGCIGGDLLETGQIGRMAHCDLTREIARTVLFEVAALPCPHPGEPHC